MMLCKLIQVRFSLAQTASQDQIFFFFFAKSIVTRFWVFFRMAFRQVCVNSSKFAVLTVRDFILVRHAKSSFREKSRFGLV